MRNVSHKISEKIKTYILYSIIPPPPPPENRAVYEIMWKNMLELGKSQMTIKIRRMPVACWIPKAIDTHSEYVILTAFPLQQRLLERYSLWRYTYIVCLSTGVLKVSMWASTIWNFVRASFRVFLFSRSYWKSWSSLRIGHAILSFTYWHKLLWTLWVFSFPRNCVFSVALKKCLDGFSRNNQQDATL